MDDHNNLDELKILLSLLTVEDEELFEICIDSLRSFTPSACKQMILDNLSIIHRVNELLPKANIPGKKIMKDFLVNIDF